MEEIMEEPESPVQRVMRLPELLSVIFDYLAAESDLLDAIETVRVVSPLWKAAAFFTLKRNMKRMPWPYITVGLNNQTEAFFPLNGVSEGRKKSLQSSSDSLKPGCGIPLQLVIGEWTPQVESFIRDFSTEIVNFYICGNDETFGFPEDMGEFELPSVKVMIFTYTCSEETEIGEMRNGVTFWNKLTSRALTNLDECFVDLTISDRRPVGPDIAALQQVVWSQVDRLSSSYEFFIEVTAGNELSALDCLTLSQGNNEDGDDLVKQISFKKVPNLSYLNLCGLGNHVDWILDHEMKKLEFLKLWERIIISGSQPPSRLLPNLVKVDSYEPKTGGRSFASLINGGGVFEKTVKLTWYESWTDLNERVGDMAHQICNSFPNLEELFWSSWRKYGRPRREENKNSLLAAPVIFSKLEFLTSLKLESTSVSERELVELLTGVSLELIPVDEDSWPTCLGENTRSICNLKRLKAFHVRLEERVSLHPRHTRFLFNAAFRTMDTLQKLSFHSIIFEDPTCVTEWQEMGREITCTDY